MITLNTIGEMISFGEWREMFSEEAKHEGWNLFECNGRLEIQRIDYRDDGRMELYSDEAALKHVIYQALTYQSQPHSLALLFHNNSTDDIQVPRHLRGAVFGRK